MDIAQLLEGIHQRTTETRWGIGTAAVYLKSIAPCFEGSDLSAKEVFQLASDEAWEMALKEAGSRLVYCDPNSEIRISSVPLLKSVDEPAKFHTLMEYDTVLLTKSKDRDGDILDPEGANIDLKMPLLWQHVPFSPIGVCKGIVSRDADHVAIRNAIADVPLGRDAAVLVEFGALRTSHGFKPYKFEPISSKQFDEKGRPNGFHVKTFDTMESSLVSVPSNVDAVVTAFSRNKFTTPLVKGWAKRFYDERPTQVPGTNLETKQSESIETESSSTKPPSIESKATSSTITADKYKTLSEDLELSADDIASMSLKQIDAIIALATRAKSLSGKTHDRVTEAYKLLSDVVETSDKDGDAAASTIKSVSTEAVGTKSIDDLTTKMMGMDSPYLEGSFEWISHKLYLTAASYLRGKGVEIGTNAYTYIIATLPDEAIVCTHTYSKGGMDLCHRIAYMLKDGKPVWEGDCKEVEIKPQIIEKMIATHRKSCDGPLDTETLKTQISKQTFGIPLKQAVETMSAVCEDAGRHLALLKSHREVEELHEEMQSQKV